MRKIIAKLRNLLVIAIVLTLSPTQIQAQDVHFTQLHAAPLAFNPALTGMFNADARISANYRRQWSSSLLTRPHYVTSAVSFDIKVLDGKEYFKTSGDVLAIGGVFILDRTAQNISNYSRLQKSSTFCSIAYHKKLTDKDYLSFGVQAGYIDKRFYPEKLAYVDFNTGLTYYKLFEMGIVKSIFAGGSAFHIFEPYESFTGSDWRMHRRIVGNAGATIQVAQNGWFLTPDFVWMQQGSAGKIMAALFITKARLFSNFDIYGGARVIMTDMISPMIGAQWGFWRFGANYDLIVGSLSHYSSRRSIEFSLQYLIGPKQSEAKQPVFPGM